MICVVAFPNVYYFVTADAQPQFVLLSLGGQDRAF